MKNYLKKRVIDLYCSKCSFSLVLNYPIRDCMALTKKIEQIV